MGISDRVTVLDHGEKIAEGIAGRGPADKRVDRGLPGPRRGGGRLTDGPPRTARRPHLLRQHPRAQGHLPDRRARRDRHAHRRQRRRQVHDAQDDQRPSPAAPGRDHVRWRADRRLARRTRSSPSGISPVTRGPAHLPADDASAKTSRWARSSATKGPELDADFERVYTSSRGSRSALARTAARCPAANSRCWPSAAR